MNKYIDADKLKEVVDRVYNQYVYDYGLSAAGSNMKWIYDAIDSLQQEQPEVDLEKEIIRYQREDMDRDTTVKDVAHHFYELGFNARKEE